MPAIFHEPSLVILLSPDQKWGCIDKKGEFVIPYQRFFWPNSFYEGLASVQLINQNGISKFCYIDKTGKIVIEPQFEAAADFFEGLASG